MVATPNIGHFLLWAAVALGMVGALPVQDSTSMVSAESSISSPIPPSETNDDVAALCTDGVSATKQNSAGGYPINNYTVVTPGMNWTSYTVDGDWYHKHYVSGPHVRYSLPLYITLDLALILKQYMTFTHASDPFGAFKCQFTCNADSKCASFFVWYGKYMLVYFDSLQSHSNPDRAIADINLRGHWH